MDSTNAVKHLTRNGLPILRREVVQHLLHRYRVDHDLNRSLERDWQPCPMELKAVTSYVCNCVSAREGYL